MRLGLFVCGIWLLGVAAPSTAATIVIYADPMSLERRTVVIDTEGPDRAFLCMLPPSISGCRAVPLKRPRR